MIALAPQRHPIVFVVDDADDDHEHLDGRLEGNTLLWEHRGRLVRLEAR